MATCRDVELRLLEIFEDQSPEDLILHLKSCANCTEKQEEWARIWGQMDRWEEEKPSFEAEASILSEIRAGLGREAARRRRMSWGNIVETLVPLLAAAALAFLGVVLGVKKIGQSLEFLSPLALLTCGIVWVAVYHIMFLLSSERLGAMYRIRGVNLSLYSKYALAGLGVWMVLAALLELGGIEKSASEFMAAKFGLGTYFFIGAIYSFFPLVSLAPFLRGKNIPNAWVHGGLLGVFFLFLLTPEIFLYCSSFSLGIGFNWTVGTIVGCATGGPAGVWLGHRGIRAGEGSSA